MCDFMLIGHHNTTPNQKFVWKISKQPLFIFLNLFNKDKEGQPNLQCNILLASTAGMCFELSKQKQPQQYIKGNMPGEKRARKTIVTLYFTE